MTGPWSFWSPNNAGNRRYVHLTHIVNPAETVSVVDRGLAAPQNGWHSAIYCDDLPGCYSTVQKTTESGYDSLKIGPSANVLARHLDTTNVLWADGHVKAVKIDFLMKTGTISGYTTL